VTAAGLVTEMGDRRADATGGAQNGKL